MIHPRVALLATLVLLGASTAGNAVTIFTATLTNGQENPPTVPTLSTGGPRPASFGTAVFVLNDDQTQMTMTATIFNIDFTGTQSPDVNDNLIAAHIHAGANLPPVNNGVVWGFFGTPFNDTTPNDVVISPFAAGQVGGTISGKWDAPEGNGTTLAAQLPNIFAGRSYINFHTVQFGGGEIRGQIAAVPEPSTIALAGIGAISLVGYRWLRPRRARLHV